MKFVFKFIRKTAICQKFSKYEFENDMIQPWIFNSFKHVAGLLRLGGGVGGKITSGIPKIGAALAKMQHLWHCHDIRLSLKERMYNTAFCSVLYVCQI